MRGEKEKKTVIYIFFKRGEGKKKKKTLPERDREWKKRKG